MLNIQALEQAFSKVSEIGKGELTFDLDGTSITVRTLLPSEEVAIQKYASVVLEESKEDSLSAGQEYLDRFQTSILSYAIVQINGLDLRDSQYIATGEVLPNGQEIKKPRTEVVRGLVTSWSRPVRSAAFRKVGELLDKVHKETSQLIRYETVDLEDEIKDLENRLAELKATLQQRKEDVQAKHPFVESVQQQVKMMNPQGTGPAQENTPATVSAPVQTVSAHPVSSTPIPAQAPPPVRASAMQKPQLEASQVLRQIEQSQVQEMEEDPYLAEIAAEEARLARIRQERLARQAQPAPQPMRRAPPHMAAQEAQQQTQQEMQENPVSATSVGTINGVEAFRLGDTQQLSNKAAPRDNKKVQIDAIPNNGTQNPRFRKPQG